MPILDGVVFNTKDFLSPFLCDVKQCKGACCFIEGELGAPLKRNEIDLIDDILPKIWDLIPEKSKEVIQREGWWKKSDGKYYTNVVENRECVFVYFEEGIARCSIERRYTEGKIQFRKPISCHLFPLREYSFFISELIYVKIPECTKAIERGIKEGIPLYIALEEALVRRFGQNWYNKLISSEIKINNGTYIHSGGRK